MAAFSSFEDIVAWQKARQLSLDIYRELKTCKDWGFRDQIQRASVSIMNNIAEGFERAGDKEFRQFLFIAKGSSGEVRSMLYLAEELGYIDKTVTSMLNKEAQSISKMLANLIKTLG